MTSHSTQSYLAENRRLAALLPGRRIKSVIRLLERPADDDPRIEWGPALLTSEDGFQWLADCEESRANILLLDPIAGQQLTRSWYGGFTVRATIAEMTERHPLRPLLTAPIAAVERIYREPSPSPGLPDSFAMCGLRLTTEDGYQVCLGTHLTDLMFTQVAFLLPDEVAPQVKYESL